MKTCLHTDPQELSLTHQYVNESFLIMLSLITHTHKHRHTHTHKFPLFYFDKTYYEHNIQLTVKVEKVNSTGSAGAQIGDNIISWSAARNS